MPELPEVQTVINNLQPIIQGKTIISIQNPNGYQAVFNNGDHTKYENFLIHKNIQCIDRRGKYIIIKLDLGYLVIHLRMTGKIIFKLPNQNELKYVSFQINFSDGSNIFFSDIRKFGRIYICTNLNWLNNKLGIEPLSDKFTSHWLYEHLHNHKRMMKPLLLDQHFIAGLGNIYVDEVLWDSNIHPKAKSNKISLQRSKSLVSSIKNILIRAIKYQGTTIINFSYGQGNNGNFSNELQIFGKPYLPCPKCKSPIIKKYIAQRGTHFCKQCQKF